MTQLVVSALLMGAAIGYIGRGDGRSRMLRHLRHGARLRRLTLVVAALVGTADLLALLLRAPLPVVDALVTLTLLTFLAAFALVLRERRRARAVRPGAPRVLAVGAHPDDLELACGGTLAKLADTGFEIRSLVMSAGQIGGDSSRRPDEARRGGAFLGASRVEVLDFPDTDLAGSSQAMVDAIEQRVTDFAPDLILTHSVNDLHQDHHAVHLAVLRAARQRSSILCFESPSTTRDFNPSVYVDISDHLDVKVEGIRCHADQRAKPYMGSDTVRGTAAFRGRQSRTPFAEGFEPVRLLADLPGLLAPALAGGTGGIPTRHLAAVPAPPVASQEPEAPSVPDAPELPAARTTSARSAASATPVAPTPTPAPIREKEYA